MGDPVDIHSLLQAGYFATSHHKTRKSNTSEPSRGLEFTSQSDERKIKRPPPPTVEDEEDVLKREHGAVKTVVIEEEANSRGDVEQNPLIMEVHEFNPERRFVILNDEVKGRDARNAEVAGDANQNERLDELRSPDSAIKGAETPGKPSPLEDGKRRHRRTPSEGQYAPQMSRRRSRQDLPAIDTGFDDVRLPQHHRSKSAACGPRPDYFSPRQARQFRDQMLSPDVIIQGNGRREPRYHGGSPRTDRPARGRYREDKKRSPPQSAGRSANSSFDSTSPIRPLSSEIESDSRSQESPQVSYYDNTSSRMYERCGNISSKSSAKTSRDHSRSNDEYSRSPRTSLDMRKPSTAQENLKVADSDDDGNKRPPANTQTEPILANKAPHASRAPETFSVPRPVVASSVDHHEEKSGKPVLPYPEDDVLYIDPAELADANRGAEESKGVGVRSETAHMPKLPPADFSEPKNHDVVADKQPGSADSRTTSASNSWKPPPFDPDRDGKRSERPVGAFRRYSESLEEESTQRLPDCQRAKPVAGKTDWLTLPRTEFNICPGCYGALFSKSEHRTEFQPVLRPTVDPIACDFGSSPWYRIAWLLMVKNKDEDLSLFRHIASIANAARSLQCPGHRRTTREWYTVWDPCTRRPVPEFTVCYQCSKTVEALLPSLSGVFVPLDPKEEPSRSICALHFAPDRTAFVLYFDSFETVAEKAAKTKKSPDFVTLAQNLERLSTHSECQEDRPITDGYWHFMQFIPDFTVCGDCFEDVVQPRLRDENVIARNFYMKPQRLPRAACQLYSSRMREVFKKACRRNDPKYLEARVRERRAVEARIKAKLAKLDRGQKDAWADKHIDDLIEEWKDWE